MGKIAMEQFKARILSENDINTCAEICVDAYSKEPWNEIHEYNSERQNLLNFLKLNCFLGFVLIRNDVIIGEILGLIIPTSSGSYYRIEDFCINPEYQNQGAGSKFIELIKPYLKIRDIDSIILNTVRDFPSFKFYNRNGFKEIKDSATLYMGL